MTKGTGPHEFQERAIDRLRAIRNYFFLTQEEVAEAIGEKKARISGLELGKYECRIKEFANMLIFFNSVAIERGVEPYDINELLFAEKFVLHEQQADMPDTAKL
ncbi:MAG: hypothetical protein GF417_00845, partial [Candidatus Latescibacteria bacterium]|nr:hypothetical protein [bacterium]MBD3422973.1 hypothetical protein [Candidatus Latescibacterota bacterium]